MWSEELLNELRISLKRLLVSTFPTFKLHQQRWSWEIKDYCCGVGWKRQSKLFKDTYQKSLNFNSHLHIDINDSTKSVEIENSVLVAGTWVELELSTSALIDRNRSKVLMRASWCLSKIYFCLLFLLILPCFILNKLTFLYTLNHSALL